MGQEVWSLNILFFASVSPELAVWFKITHRRSDPAVYPYSDIYPACSMEEDISQPVSVMLNQSNTLLTSYPSLVICMG